ncbi:SDR family NAD(P)-dependent oxidoreductase [Geodermatophilus marinus]|uniref:SDR family NAD(P)-dependent oxidoreductase n=1 Tax=Geodermatophilus sp. LHW52908 TaxID=2303986 RepID=UPI000E3B72D4|nr:SDR family oxidoreductase [Geodermatophilus sp. LHW52908]RFU18927.1 SDR family oxidoreductase [Geodermatophilus sp. LHW52908]
MRPYTFAGGTAVVTGAAGGIGAALARGLARRGSSLVLLDRDAAGLEAVAGAIRAAHPSVSVTTHVVDLADPAATRAAGETLRERHPETTLLVNNAGVALAGRFDQVTAEEFDWLLQVNLHAVVTLTRALLPALKAHPGSHLVTVSSLFGLIAPAGQSAYATSKFAVRGFTEALRHELAADGVGVTSVHPGGIRTRIAADARIGSGVPAAETEAGRRDFERLLTMDPAKAAEVVLRAVERRRPRQLVGWSAVVPDLLARLLPGAHGRLLAALGRRR